MVEWYRASSAFCGQFPWYNFCRGPESLKGRDVYHPGRVTYLPRDTCSRWPWGTKGGMDLCGKPDLLCTDMGGETACSLGPSGPWGSVRPTPHPMGLGGVLASTRPWHSGFCTCGLLSGR